MAYEVTRQGRKFVVLSPSGEPVGVPHASESAALAQAQALTADGLSKAEQLGSGVKTLFIPLAKVDEKKRQVWGWGADETPDVADEVCDYHTSKPKFEKWSNAAAARTGGKSLGNLRSMHQSVAAGRLIAFKPDDAQRGFWIGAEVVDDGEWAKVQKGVYSGFSIGGSYASRWFDPKLNKTRYTADPIEISLVDAPCNPAATFQFVKANGAAELRKFNPTDGQNLLKADMPRSPSPTGEVDPGDVRWGDITVDRMPDRDDMMQISPANPPSGDTLAARHRGVVELTAQLEELMDASGAGDGLRKAAADLITLAKAEWEESKHKRGEGGKFASGSGGEGGSHDPEPGWSTEGPKKSSGGFESSTHTKEKHGRSAEVTHNPGGQGGFSVHTKASAGDTGNVHDFKTKKEAYAHAQEHLYGDADPGIADKHPDGHISGPGGEAHISTAAGGPNKGKHFVITGSPEKGFTATVHDTREAAEAHAQAHVSGGGGDKPKASAEGHSRSNPFGFTPEQIAQDKIDLAAGHGGREHAGEAGYPAAVLRGKAEDDPAVSPAQHRAMQSHYTATGDKAKAEFHAGQADKKSGGDKAKPAPAGEPAKPAAPSLGGDTIHSQRGYLHNIDHNKGYTATLTHKETGETQTLPISEASHKLFDHPGSHNDPSPYHLTTSEPEHHKPAGEGWERMIGGIGYHKETKGKGGGDAHIYHPQEEGGKFITKTFNFNTGESEKKEHPTREAAYAHAEQHLANVNGDKPKAAPAAESAGGSFTDKMKAAGASPESDRAALATGDTATHSPAVGKPRPAGGDSLHAQVEAKLANGEDVSPEEIKQAHQSALSAGDKDAAASLGQLRQAMGDLPLKTSGLTHQQYDKIMADWKEGNDGGDPDEIVRAHAHAVESGNQEDASDLREFMRDVGIKPNLKPKGPWKGGQVSKSASSNWEHNFKKVATFPMPDVIATASFEHHQRDGEIFPDADAQGVILMDSSRVRGKGGTVGLSPVHKVYGAMYRAEGSAGWAVETGRLGGPVPEMTASVRVVSSPQVARVELMKYLSGSDQVEAPARRVAVTRHPELAKRGAVPFEKRQRLIKVNSANPAAAPESVSGPRMVKVTSSKEK